MAWWEAVVLGVVQGLTEFFPVSSSGHLVMTQELMGLRVPGIGFEVALHVATLVSVLLVYRQRVLSLARGLWPGRARGAEEPAAWPYVLMLVLASVPAAVVGVGFEDWFEARFDDARFAGTMLLVTGAVVWSSRWARGTRRGVLFEALPVGVAAVVSVVAGTVLPFAVVLAVMTVLMVASRLTAPAEWTRWPTWGGAVLMGVAQAAAILPGISRSGSTVLAGLWRRIEPEAAAEFSFLMSVPAILGAALLSLPELTESGAVEAGVVPIAAGSVAAAVSGVLAIRFFVALLRRRSFHSFAIYCWVAATAFLLVR